MWSILDRLDKARACKVRGDLSGFLMLRFLLHHEAELRAPATLHLHVECAACSLSVGVFSLDHAHLGCRRRTLEIRLSCASRKRVVAASVGLDYDPFWDDETDCLDGLSGRPDPSGADLFGRLVRRPEPAWGRLGTGTRSDS